MCNSSLNLLGASNISALTENSKNARLCNQRFSSIRDRVFRSHNWNCLLTRKELAADSVTPIVEYAYAYTIPANCLRVIAINNGSTDSIKSNLEYKVEGRKILTGESTVFLLYIKIDEDPNTYDTYLREAITHELAADLCYAITNNSTLATKYLQKSKEILREARFIDATENSLAIIESSSLTDARL
jgi:hypothetical protein